MLTFAPNPLILSGLLFVIMLSGLRKFTTSTINIRVD